MAQESDEQWDNSFNSPHSPGAAFVWIYRVQIRVWACPIITAINIDWTSEWNQKEDRAVKCCGG